METLIKKRKNGIKTDDYGNIDATKWIKETQTFVDKMFVPLLTPDEAKAVKFHGVSKFATTYIEDPVRTQSFYKRIQSERHLYSMKSTVQNLSVIKGGYVRQQRLLETRAQILKLKKMAKLLSFNASSTAALWVMQLYKKLYPQGVFTVHTMRL